MSTFSTETIVPENKLNATDSYKIKNAVFGCAMPTAVVLANKAKNKLNKKIDFHSFHRRHWSLGLNMLKISGYSKILQLIKIKENC